VIYDGIFLLSLVLLQEYPIDKLAIGLTMFNPIDLGRILMMLQLDISALMGYTGAVFNKFFGTQMGIWVSLGVSLVWVAAPVGLILRFGQKKDF
jgi:Cu-processing system permease protein